MGAVRDGRVPSELDADLVEQLAQVPGRRGPSLLHDLVPDLVGALDDAVRQVEQAIERGLRMNAARLVHELAGSLGAVGAREAATALSSLESAIRVGGDPSALRAQLRAMGPVVRRAKVALLAVVAAPTPADDRLSDVEVDQP